MIDQVIIACDQSFTVLYNNYHEKFYDKIMRGIASQTNLNELRRGSGSKLDKFFAGKIEARGKLDTEIWTMQLLCRMVDELNESNKSASRDSSILTKDEILLMHMVGYLSDFKTKLKRLTESANSRQMTIEANISKYTSSQPIVTLDFLPF